MMKKQKMLFAIAILSAYSFLAAENQETLMKLVNTKTGFVLVEFKNGLPTFTDRFLEAEMKERGVSIPAARRNDFQGKDTVLLNDPLFQKAFVEIYVPLSIASPVYQWQQ